MAVWVSLLRGVNVGRRRVAMPGLRAALSEAGFGNVRTYVQTGNVVTESDHADPAEVAAAVRRVVEERFCPNVPVIVRSPAELAAVLQWCPFPEDARERPTMVHVVHLAATPDAGRRRALLAADVAPDGLAARGDEVVLRYATTMHGSPLQYVAVLKKLGVDGTARNWRTLQALVELSGAR